MVNYFSRERQLTRSRAPTALVNLETINAVGYGEEGSEA